MTLPSRPAARARVVKTEALAKLLAQVFPDEARLLRASLRMSGDAQFAAVLHAASVLAHQSTSLKHLDGAVVPVYWRNEWSSDDQMTERWHLVASEANDAVRAVLEAFCEEVGA